MKTKILKSPNLKVKANLPNTKTDINKEIATANTRITKSINKNRINTDAKHSKDFIVK